MIRISRTYEIITEESAEHGEAEERGFDFENVEVTFRELVDYLREHSEPSSRPCTGSRYEWFTQYGEADFRTGDVENYSIHFAGGNPKYWEKAVRAAGLCR